MKKSELIFSAILIPVDYLMLLTAGLLAYYLRFETALTDIRPVFYEMSFTGYLFIILVVSLVFLIVFTLSGLYNIKGTRRSVDEYAKVFVACSAAFMLLLLVTFFQRELFSSRFIILTGYIFSIIFVSIGRFFVRLIQRSLFKKGIGVHKVLVVGQDKEADNIVKEINLYPNLGYRIVACLDNFSEENLAKAENIIKENNIDELIQAESNLAKEQVLNEIEFCNNHHIIFKYAAGLAEAQRVHLDVNAIGGVPIIEVKKTPLDGWGKIIKRFFDIVLSFLALIILLPLFLIVALAVKIDSRGPVFARLKRIGEGGRRFTLFKFRSMIKGAHAMKKDLVAMNERKDGPLFKIKNDPRITRVGRFIRKTSLDELPQLFNVLRGEMSLVGPRPHEPEEVASYEKHHRKLLAIKPGITGLAQVSGRSDLLFEEEVKLDIHYIENWSLKLDLQIILKTPFVVLSTKSAN
ncbi:MAG: sugar transferase [Patescibacteria group bacterium]|nr:sugar transferase [Patescibacteria group bacterium]